MYGKSTAGMGIAAVPFLPNTGFELGWWVLTGVGFVVFGAALRRLWPKDTA